MNTNPDPTCVLGRGLPEKMKQIFVCEQAGLQRVVKVRLYNRTTADHTGQERAVC